MTVGFTVILPLTATAPTPLSIDTLSAPVVVQLRLADPPTVIETGVVEKLSTVGGVGGGAGLTVTVTFADDAPAGPMAVRIYSVVVVGLTEMLPSRGKLGPALITTLSAPVVVQLKMDDSPTVIEIGVAKKLSMGGFGELGTTVITTVSVLVAP